jgi:hypothetical protein
MNEGAAWAAISRPIMRPVSAAVNEFPLTSH